MSVWPSSLSPPRFCLALVLMVVVMHSECNAAAKRSRQPVNSPQSRQAKSIAQTYERIQKVEQALAPLKSSTKGLSRKFAAYSGRTARHAWKSHEQQLSAANNIRHDAQELRAKLEAYEEAIKDKLGPTVIMNNRATLRRIPLDATAKNQLDQTTKIYKRILELLQNMIECPVHILQLLGDDSVESEEDGMAPEDGESGGDESGRK